MQFERRDRSRATPGGSAPSPGPSELERRAPERRYQPAPPKRDETFLEGLRDFLRRVWVKADQDGIFFMSGAIAFNLIVAIVPLLLAVLGITGVVLQNRVEDPSKLLADYIFEALPPAGPEFRRFVEDEIITGLLRKAGGFIGFGLLVLVWVSTRLVGTLRFVLREVFDVGEDRNIIRGKWFDVQMVVVAGILFAIVPLLFGTLLMSACAERWEAARSGPAWAAAGAAGGAGIALLLAASGPAAFALMATSAVCGWLARRGVEL